MKKIKKILPFLLITLLTGCNKTASSSFSCYSFDNYSPIITKKNIDDNQIFYQHDTFSDINYYDKYNNQTSSSYSLLMPRKSHMTSSGVAKLLVIPVSLTSSSKETSIKEKKRIDIQNSFFGDKEHNSYYSIAEYYYRSSYGALRIEGTVTDWFDYEKIISPSAGGQNTSEIVLKEALTAINNNPSKYFLDKNYSSLEDFLGEGSDHIDGIFMVYDHPYSTSVKDDDVFWAFTNSVEPNETTKIKEGVKYAYYSWASYDFLHEKKNIIDARTFIHETGHLLGLEDYYNSGYSFQPTGGMDMMDSNLGDQNAFSKMLLNWTTPKVVIGSGEVTISSFQSSGDVLLIPFSSGYNDSPLDEYLLLEYFTPSTLNDHLGEQYSMIDSKGNSHIFSYFSSYGIKLYRINASMGYFSNDRMHMFYRYIEEGGAISNTAIIDYRSENNGYTSSTYEPLCHLLEKGNKKTFEQSVPGTNDALFIVNDTFNPRDFSFDVNFAFTVNRVSETTITLTFFNA